MSLFRECHAVTMMGLRGIPSRLSDSLVIIIGAASAVGVFISILALATGFRTMLQHTGQPDRAIILRAGSASELGSTLSRESASTILDAAEVRRDGTGRPIGSADVVVLASLAGRTPHSAANVVLRGIGPNGLATRPEIKLLAGRLFRPGTREVVVGESAASQFEALRLGQRLSLPDGEWSIVGIFGSGGGIHNSEMLGDAETVLSAYSRTMFQSVTATLDGADAFDRLKQALESNPALAVEVVREPQYYEILYKPLEKILFLVSFGIGGIMALGAIFAIVDVIYSAVEARSVEIAILRALGYTSVSVISSILAEAMLLAGVGGALGAVVAWALFNGNAASTLGGNYSQTIFRVDIQAEVVLIGLVAALLVGLLGGLVPALAAARRPVAAALQPR
jgi:putative ABC transport system permease protein